ncbi:hypothetical protein F0L68_09075 [Solihabitans fulvus]|uniref:Uncharacterized protein n=1 Tax=Solihabitans fulvus TaxID=1892852 RepID=A0A5B2XL33_9PSEU|nr:hypothetical protein [Solihabitans fulvus]KAA2263814.1 hypothetical protein F0L68_09075 [Solihabitans fulvus]
MAVQRGPERWLLILLVVGLAGIGAAAAAWWPSSGASTTDGGQPVSATVVTPAPCEGANAYDTVELKLGNDVRQARLNGCGHRKGEVVDVLLPSNTDGQFQVETADSRPTAVNLHRRLSALLLCLSALAGASYAVAVGRRRDLAARAATPTGDDTAPKPTEAVAAAEPAAVAPAPFEFAPAPPINAAPIDAAEAEAAEKASVEEVSAELAGLSGSQTGQGTDGFPRPQ